MEPLGDRMNGYPIQPAKVQRPPLRDETLARDRLLDWLAAKIHHRVILVLADAGYGKTTLLADFSRRTRLRTLWYRLDDDDRDWISFLSHLVAAGPRARSRRSRRRRRAMLQRPGHGRADARGRDRRLPARAADDRRARRRPDPRRLPPRRRVAGRPDHRARARRARARAPVDRVRQPADAADPAGPAARRRARSPRSGPTTSASTPRETARLFSETYGRELEPDVLADVAARTEGWAASLQLVQAALRDRSPAEIRRFVRGLTGADQELYDYLAEEVVGDLPDDLQRFLMRTSILQVVTPELAAVVAGLDAADDGAAHGAAERLTLLAGPGRSQRGPQRYHPLVREFLEARLRVNGRRPGSRGAPPPRRRTRPRPPIGASPRTTTARPATPPPSPPRSPARSPKSWAAANTWPQSKKSTRSRKRAQLPVLEPCRLARPDAAAGL